MDLDYIARHAQAAREFTHAIGPVTFTLRVPTKLESSIAYTQAHTAAGRDGSAGVRFERALVVTVITGWSGVLVRHVLTAHAGDDPLAFEPRAAAVLFDSQPEWEAGLLQALMTRVAERQAIEDTAAKN